jgi:hypothetical protein
LGYFGPEGAFFADVDFAGDFSLTLAIIIRMIDIDKTPLNVFSYFGMNAKLEKNHSTKKLNCLNEQ